MTVTGELDIVNVLLSLTALSRNPQADLHAVGRAHRIGWIKQVNVNLHHLCLVWQNLDATMCNYHPSSGVLPFTNFMIYFEFFS
jgi:hypothetical protein